MKLLETKIYTDKDLSTLERDLQHLISGRGLCRRSVSWPGKQAELDKLDKWISRLEFLRKQIRRHKRQLAKLRKSGAIQQGTNS
jgi:hypothetical protein